MLTQERLKELLQYDELTGVFTWAVFKGRVTPGDIAGTPHTQGYLQLKIDGVRYFAHRLVWLYIHGKFLSIR